MRASSTVISLLPASSLSSWLVATNVKTQLVTTQNASQYPWRDLLKEVGTTPKLILWNCHYTVSSLKVDNWWRDVGIEHASFWSHHRLGWGTKHFAGSDYGEPVDSIMVLRMVFGDKMEMHLLEGFQDHNFKIYPLFDSPHSYHAVIKLFVINTILIRLHSTSQRTQTTGVNPAMDKITTASSREQRVAAIVSIGSRRRLINILTLPLSTPSSGTPKVIVEIPEE